MILVAAARGDATARSFVSRHSSQSILLSPVDLSLGGWRYHPGHAADSTLVASGKSIHAGEVTGILNRLTWVLPSELLDIKAEDRMYASAEMTAFLISWLSEAPCRVLNRPATVGQSGASWPSEKWIATAAQLGVPVRPMLRHATRQPEMPMPMVSHDHCVSTTVVGDCCVGEVDQSLRGQARCLSQAARLNLFSLHYSSPRPHALFLHADVMPNIEAGSEVEHCILNYLTGKDA
jgi:hypothetical protein